MKKKRKTTLKNKKSAINKLLYGGMSDEEKTFRLYADKIKNGENIIIEEFKSFLDNVENPLLKDFRFDDSYPNTYTINEWAFLHSCPISVQDIFRNYKISYKRRNIYKKRLYNEEDYSILEAYVIIAEQEGLIRTL